MAGPNRNRQASPDITSISSSTLASSPSIGSSSDKPWKPAARRPASKPTAKDKAKNKNKTKAAATKTTANNNDRKPSAKPLAKIPSTSYRRKTTPTKRMFPTNRTFVRQQTAAFRSLLGQQPFLKRTLTPLWTKHTTSNAYTNANAYVTSNGIEIPSPTLVITHLLADEESEAAGVHMGLNTTSSSETMYLQTISFVTRSHVCPLCHVQCQSIPYLIRHLRSNREHPYYVCDVQETKDGTGTPHGNVFHIQVRPIDVTLTESFHANHVFVRRQESQVHTILSRHRICRPVKRRKGSKKVSTIRVEQPKPAPIIRETKEPYRYRKPFRIQPLTLDRKECLAPPPSSDPKKVHLPARNYYHRRSDEPKRFTTFEDDSSDDDSDQEPMDALCNGMLSEFEDVSDDERRLFILWGMFIRRQQRPFQLDTLLMEKVVAFIYENSVQLVGLRWVFLKHVQNLCLMPSGLTGEKLLVCMRLFDQVVEVQPPIHSTETHDEKSVARMPPSKSKKAGNLKNPPS